ncbi:MAG: hypothetical protein U9N81_13375 [Bacillota bacterium]|nr:hypothetical protein [Bacillota bacterium]
MITKTTIIRGTKNGIGVMWELAKVVIPVYFAVTFLKYTPVLPFISKHMTGIMHLVGLPGEAALPLVMGYFLTIYLAIGAMLPLLAGLFFGISYGAGIIINCAQEGKLRTEDIYTINLYLVICHSLFEDTLLFAAIGANWLPIVVGRIILATLVCFCWSRWSYFHTAKTSGTSGSCSLLDEVKASQR